METKTIIMTERSLQESVQQQSKQSRTGSDGGKETLTH